MQTKTVTFFEKISISAQKSEPVSAAAEFLPDGMDGMDTFCIPGF